jgi:hypothetical protein
MYTILKSVEQKACSMKHQQGDVAATLLAMAGIWHDKVELFHLDGTPLDDDTQAGSGTPGASPFENFVYLSFDGTDLALTNVHIKGRPPIAKTFRGKMRDGLLVFDSLGDGAFENVGVSGGLGILTFNARTLEPACNVYMEPDFIIQLSPTTRVRHTVLYRGGLAVRTLTARGTKISDNPNVRHRDDPRGSDGPVHEETFTAGIWRHLLESKA